MAKIDLRTEFIIAKNIAAGMFALIALAVLALFGFIEHTMTVGWIALGIGAFIVINYKWPRDTHKNCPLCEHAFSIKYNWTCNKCKKRQGKDAFIYSPCIHCSNRLESFFCSECKGELSLKPSLFRD